MSENLDILYGIHAVMEALKSKKRNVVQLYVADNKAGHRAVEEIIRLAKRNNVKIDRMDVKMMDRLTKGGNHQGVLAKAQPVRLMKLSTALYESDGNKKDLWLAVDEMTDPQNLGASVQPVQCPAGPERRRVLGIRRRHGRTAHHANRLRFPRRAGHRLRRYRHTRKNRRKLRPDYFHSAKRRRGKFKRVCSGGNYYVRYVFKSAVEKINYFTMKRATFLPRCPF